MTTYFMFGDYTKDAADGINSKRTEQAEATILGYGGKLRSIYALLGSHDLVIIADLPGNEEAVQVSIEIMRSTGITFSTCPALPVVEFDRIITE